MPFFNLFRNSDADDDQPSISLRKAFQNKKVASEDEARKLIDDALVESQTQKNIYGVRIKRAINNAKTALAANDTTGYAIARQELKFSYGVYQYMTTLHNTFRILDSNLTIMGMTQQLAKTVDALSNISVPANTFNFDKLTAKALRSFKGVDMIGLDGMFQQLIQGSMQATSTASGATDDFLDKLIRGEVSMDTPYAQASGKTVIDDQPAAPAQPAAANTNEDTAALIKKLDEMIARTTAK